MTDRSSTVWTVTPVKTLSIGDVLIPMVEFPKNDRRIRCRKQGEYDVHCVIEGDGAVALRQLGVPLPALTVTEVSGLSGFGKAKLMETS